MQARLSALRWVPEWVKWMVRVSSTLFWLGGVSWLIDWWQTEWHWRWVPVQAVMLGIGLLLIILVYTWAVWRRPYLIGGFTSTWGKRTYMIVMSPVLIPFIVGIWGWKFFEDTSP